MLLSVCYDFYEKPLVAGDQQVCSICSLPRVQTLLFCCLALLRRVAARIRFSLYSSCFYDVDSIFIIIKVCSTNCSCDDIRTNVTTPTNSYDAQLPTQQFASVMITKSFCRKLLKEYHRVRLKPYHIQDTLYLLALPQAALSSPAPAGELPTTPCLGVDANCDPVEPCRHPPIDAHATYVTGLMYLRRALRGKHLVSSATSTVTQEAPSTSSSAAFLQVQRAVDQSKMFWLMRRLVNLNNNPHRVPSAAALGVQRSIMLPRPGSDAFPLSSLFLGMETSQQHTTSTSRFSSARAVDLVKYTLPTNVVVTHHTFKFTIDAEEYEGKFVPHPLAINEDGTPVQPTHQRYILRCRIEHTNSFFKTFVVHSQLQALDLSSMTLVEEAGTLVPPTDIPLLSKAVKVGHQDVAIIGAPTVTESPLAPHAEGQQSASTSWSATWQLVDSVGPVAMKGVLYVKQVVVPDNRKHIKHDTAFLLALHQAPIVAVPIPLFALRQKPGQ